MNRFQSEESVFISTQKLNCTVGWNWQEGIGKPRTVLGSGSPSALAPSAHERITERASWIQCHGMFAGFIDRFTTVMREPMYALGNALSDIIYASEDDRSSYAAVLSERA